jgi:predicted nucleic acid-binding protein
LSIAVYVLDTSVLSELARPRPHGAVVAWLKAVRPEHLFLSAVTIGEIQIGIQRTRDNDPRQANSIESWLLQVIATCRVVPMSEIELRIWARLMHRTPQHLYVDAVIAATALSRRFTVATCDVSGFATFEVSTFNPFGARSSQVR